MADLRCRGPQTHRHTYTHTHIRTTAHTESLEYLISWLSSLLTNSVVTFADRVHWQVEIQPFPPEPTQDGNASQETQNEVVGGDESGTARDWHVVLRSGRKDAMDMLHEDAVEEV